MSATLVVERVIEQPLERVWATLVDPASQERWLAAHGFAARPGHRFSFTMPRGPGFDGRVQAEVLEVSPGSKLRLWCEGGPVRGHVTFTLTPAGRGTRLRMEQTGFDQPAQHALAPVLLTFWSRAIEHQLPAAAAVGGAVGTVAAGGVTGLVWGITAAVSGIVALILFLGLFLGWGTWAPEGGSGGARGSTGGPVEPVLADGQLPTALEPEAIRERTASGTDDRTGAGSFGALHPVALSWSNDGGVLAIEWRAEDGRSPKLSFAHPDDGMLGPLHWVRLPGDDQGDAPSTSTAGSWHRAGLLVFSGAVPGGRSDLWFVMPGGAQSARLSPHPPSLTASRSRPAVGASAEAIAFLEHRGRSWALRLWRVTQDPETLYRGDTGADVFGSPTLSRTGDRVAVIERSDQWRIRDVSVVNQSSSVAYESDLALYALAYADRTLLVLRGHGEVAELLAVDPESGRSRRLIPRVRVPEGGSLGIGPLDDEVVVVSADRPDELVVVNVETGELEVFETGRSNCRSPALTRRNGARFVAFAHDRDPAGRQVSMIRLDR